MKTFLRFKNFTSLFLFLSVMALIQMPIHAQNSSNLKSEVIRFATPIRPAEQKNVLQLKCDPIPIVRIAFIGLGMRGSEALRRFMYQEGVEVVALCDVNKDFVENAQKVLSDNKKKRALEFYNGPDDWKKVCELKNVDLVYSCTPWGLHTPIAVYAMEHGKHVATEVPAATTVEECWQLVNTSEKTRKHCMMLENCTYDFFEMATLNMAQKGLFGEIVHVEGAYIHDLRYLNFETPEKGGYQNMWRLKLSEKHTGNPYPTHGLGPVCQVLNIHRGDKMNTLVSMSSNQFGMTEYAKQKYGENADSAKINYDLGDMNTTLIRTEKGKTIMIQHDVTNPRPYNRIHMISGTKGFAQKYPVQGFAFDPKAHTFLPQAEMDSLLNVYTHPIVRQIGEKAKEVGGHGGMDFIMDSRLIYCLRNGLPLDEDVYDAAEWSCLTELTELSVRNGSVPVEIPDFTRGDWNKLPGLQFAK